MRMLLGLFITGLFTCSQKTDVHSTLMLDKRVWMTANLNVNVPDSYCQRNDMLNCNTYGRLYTWEAAVNGCNTLGQGWRLPTDKEWQQLAKQYGGLYDNSEDYGKSAYLNLTKGGSTEFNALLGGNRQPDGNYERLGAHGFYWTSTELDSAEAWFYTLVKRQHY